MRAVMVYESTYSTTHLIADARVTGMAPSRVAAAERTGARRSDQPDSPS